MSNWQIGESGTAIVLDGAGRGEVSLTVTNTAPTQDRAVLTVTALDGAAESWFTIDQPQKAVPPGQSVTYLCSVVVPPETAPAVYACQFVVYSADRDPGETSATSRRVTLEKKAPAVAPPRKPWWPFLVAAVVVAIVIGVVLWLLLKDDGGFDNTEAPVIDGAAEVLQVVTASPGEWSEEGLEFSFEWQRCDADGAACTAIDGATLPAYAIGVDDVDATLRVQVTATTAEGESAGAVSEPVGPVGPVPVEQVPMPDVVGSPRSDAVRELRANFQVEVLLAGTAVRNCNPPVESQGPAPDVVLNRGERVAISIPPPTEDILCLDLRFPVLTEQFQVFPEAVLDDASDGP